MTERTLFTEHKIICLTCGYDGDKMLELDRPNGFPKHDITKCPKCSKKAYVLNPLRTQFVISALAKEIVKLRMDVFDVQSGIEESDQ